MVAPPSGMVLILVENSVRRHDLCRPICILATMNEETGPIKLLHVGLRLTEPLPRHVGVDQVPRDMLRPVPPLLYQELAVDSLLMKRRHSRSDAKAAIPRHHLSRPVNRLRHIEEELDRLRLPLVLPLCRKRPPPVSQLRPILPLDQSNPPHDRVLHVLIRVGDGMILIAERPRLSGTDHKPRAELVEPAVHRLVEAAEPRG